MNARAVKRFGAALVVIESTGLPSCRAEAQEARRVLRIAVMNDQHGAFSSNSGSGSNAAAQLAIDDSGGRAGPFKVELLSYDHQNKPDVGVALARRAFERYRVSAMFDLANSAISLAVQKIGRDNKMVVVHVGSAHPDLFKAECSPTSAVWLYDLESLAVSSVRADPELAASTWYLLGSDYLAGKTTMSITSRLVAVAGGRVLGTALTPVGQSDYSSVLLQAKASGPRWSALPIPATTQPTRSSRRTSSD